MHAVCCVWTLAHACEPISTVKVVVTRVSRRFLTPGFVGRAPRGVQTVPLSGRPLQRVSGTPPHHGGPGGPPAERNATSGAPAPSPRRDPCSLHAAPGDTHAGGFCPLAGVTLPVLVLVIPVQACRVTAQGLNAWPEQS